MLNLFPYTNLHNLNLDWIIRKIKTAVYTINGNAPDDDGNIVVPTSPVLSVNGKTGTVELDAADVGATPAGQGIPAGGAALAPLMKSSGTEYDTEWGTNGRITVTADNLNNFTVNAIQCYKWGQVCFLNISYNITASSATGTVLATLTDAPVPVFLGDMAAMISRAASNSTSLTGIVLNRDGNTVRLRATGSSNVGNFFTATFVYICL